MRKSIPLLIMTIFAAACTPPAPATAPTPSSIDAGFNQTWDAVIDILAERNVPVKTLDRSSGFVAAEVATMSLQDLSDLTTNCGGFMDLMLNSKSPFGFATYNILVRGDSTTSNVKVTARFSHGASTCVTKNVFESGFQTGVKERAEAARGTRSVVSNQPTSRPVTAQSPSTVTTRGPTKAPAPIRPTPVDAASGQKPSVTSSSATIGAPQSEADRAAGAATFVEANAYVGSHDWVKAEQSYQKAILYDGSVAKYHAGMGALMMILHRWIDAEASYSAAMLLDVDNPDYREKLKEARARR